MALWGAVAKPLIDHVLGPLCNCITQTFQYTTSIGRNIDSLNREMEILRSTRDDVRNRVADAELRGQQPKQQVILWLERVATLDVETTTIGTDFQRRCKCVAGCAPNICSSHHLSKLPEEKVAEVRDLLNRGAAFGEVADDFILERVVQRPAASTASCVGMQEVLEQLNYYVEGNEVGIIVIYGMAGVGKTALVEKFNNQFILNYIDVAFWVDMSNKPSVEEIQGRIGARLGIRWKEGMAQEERASHICKVLSKKKFVLFLDSMWERLDLQAVGIPFPEHESRSKIILTTQLEHVCDQMAARKKIKVECLKWEQAWSLFEEQAGRELITSDPSIHQNAVRLVEKCGGLPLALITVGRAMASKKSPIAWWHAVNTFNTSPTQLPGMKGGVLDRLKLSYENLPDDKLRTCFLYHSLFPEDFPIFLEYLIAYWIGEGIIDEFNYLHEAGLEAVSLLSDLYAATLAEEVDGGNFTKMQPMMRIMALWVACDCGLQEDKWLVRQGEGLTEAPETQRWSRAERISLGYNCLSALPDAPQCPELLFLRLPENEALHNIPHGFFQFMPGLEVLDLQSTSIEELPSGIGKLILLQYLNLSQTRISSLPNELGALTKLRFLGLSSTTRLIKIPDGVIAGLYDLRVLLMDDSYSNWKVGPSGIGVDFEEVERLKRLNGLGITIRSAQALQRFSGSSRLASATTFLNVICWQGLTTIQLSSRMFNKIRKLWRLRIHGSNELEEVVLGAGDDGSDLLKPSSLSLSWLGKARIIWKGTSIHVNTLCISNCNDMEQLIYCDNEAIQNEGGSRTPTAFPDLRDMYLDELPNLSRLYHEESLPPFPSLQVIRIRRCPKLKRLTLLERCPMLREIRGEESWWNALEWESDHINSQYQPLFAPV